MLYKYIIFIIALFFITLQVSAQVFTVKGVVSKNLSNDRIAHVLITDLKTLAFIESDDLGWFSIKSAVGDTLLFTKTDFVPLKIVIVNSGDIPVYMEPVIALNEVTIQGQTKKQELKDVMADYRKQGTFYDGKPPVMSFLTSPITGLYELFGTTPGRAKKFAAFSKEELEADAVQKRYNAAVVKRITNAPDTVVTKFMMYYKPSYEDIKQWNDYELIKHIQKSFDYYEKSGNKEALENLNTPPLIEAPEKKKVNTPSTVYQN